MPSWNMPLGHWLRKLCGGLPLGTSGRIQPLLSRNDIVNLGTQVGLIQEDVGSPVAPEGQRQRLVILCLGNQGSLNGNLGMEAMAFRGYGRVKRVLHE